MRRFLETATAVSISRTGDRQIGRQRGPMRRLVRLTLTLWFAGCSTSNYQIASDGGVDEFAVPPPSGDGPAASRGADLAPSSCHDGVKDGDETDVDCGGSVCPACAAGLACLHGSDCQSTFCSNNRCDPPTCRDGVK